MAVHGEDSPGTDNVFLKRLPLPKWWLFSIPLRRKGLAVICGLLLCQLIVIGLFIQNQMQEDHAKGLVLHSQKIIQLADSCLDEIVQAQSAARGYILSGSKVFLKEFESIIASPGEKLLTLQDKVADNPEQLARVQNLQYKANEFQNLLGEMISYVKTGHAVEAVKIVQSLRPNHVLHSLREDLREFIKAETALRQSRDRAAKKAYRAGATTLICVCLAAVLIGLIGATLFDLAIAQRIANLQKNVERLANGKELLPLGRGGDEIAKLDYAFHGLADSLREKTVENEIFVYGVSHDIRSPVINLQGFSDEASLLLVELKELVNKSSPENNTRMSEVLNQDFPQTLHFIKRAGERLSSITQALLRLSRAGRAQYQWQMVNLEPCIIKCSELFAGALEHKGATITYDPLPEVYGDPSALEQVFANLLDNAVKYLDPSKKGEIHIGVCPESRSSDSATLYVRDNGLGMSADAVVKVFRPFQRFHPDLGPGEGVGLTMAHRIVERHGGSMWVESQLGEGTCFFVSLYTSPQDDLLKKFVNEDLWSSPTRSLHA